MATGISRLAMVVVVAVTLGACNAKGGQDYSEAADSGAVAPAARPDTSMTRNYPDSTTGGPQRTGQPAPAGDTLATRGRTAGTGARPDTTRKRP